jgi:hypothetical protein
VVLGIREAVVKPVSGKVRGGSCSAGLLTVWSPMWEAGADNREASPLFGRPSSLCHHLLSRHGKRLGIALLAGAVIASGVTAVAFWVPREQAQLLLTVFSTLAAAAITGWLSFRRPRS